MKRKAFLFEKGFFFSMISIPDGMGDIPSV